MAQDCVSGVFNTGLDIFGALLSASVPDPHWTVSDGSGNTTQAIANRYEHFIWKRVHECLTKGTSACPILQYMGFVLSAQVF